MHLSDRTTARWNEPPFVVRVTTDASRPSPLRSHEALLVRDRALECPSGFKMYLSLDDSLITCSNDVRVVGLPPTLSYIQDGDIVIVRPLTGGLRVMYRKSSHHNSLMVTPACNNLCVMCSLTLPAKNVSLS
jgi:hypothetical protein